MKFETLKKDNKKKITIITIAVISITLVGMLAGSFAKYKLTQSIPLANGTINYKVYDFKIMAMYQQKEDSNCTEDNCYEEIEVMPNASNYKINETNSYCSIDNKNKDAKAILKTENGKHTISNLSKSDKCYLYFDKSMMNGSSELLSRLSVKYGVPNFTEIATTDEGIYGFQDNDGISYYYRGAVTNNYLKFAGFWWRIIRINGDGTIRIIYDGSSYHANGTSTTDSIAVANTNFNKNYNDAIYVGFKYGTEAEGRGLANKSKILTTLETWYNNNLVNYANKIDTNAGFCGDRTAYTNTAGTTIGTGYGTSAQYFADYIRLVTNKAPVLTCANSADLYTVSGASKGNKSLEKPIGLINANEVVIAGGTINNNNQSYYLYNGQYYWTMSPYSYDVNHTAAYVFDVYENGNLLYNGTDREVGVGIRPVINLRADVPIIGSGTGENPFVVN